MPVIRCPSCLRALSLPEHADIATACCPLCRATFDVTEAQWLACEDPEAMLAFLRGRASERKLRLFACACCRKISELIGRTRHGLRAVAAGEQMADGLLPAEGASDLPSQLWNEGFAWIERDGHAARLLRDYVLYHAAFAAIVSVQKRLRCPGTTREDFEVSVLDASLHAAHAVAHAERSGDEDPTRDEIVERERDGHARLLREIFGNPFATLDPAWRTPDVLDLAQAAYDERHLPAGTLDAARLAVLADALEEAGCSDGAMLCHLREPGTHVRGCWVVDLILNRE
jgi:hypothetical protein